MKISIFPKAKMPTNKEEKKIFAKYTSKPYLPKILDCKDIKDLIKNITTFSWSPNVFKEYRRQDGFLSTDFLVLDIDNDVTIQDSLIRIKNKNLFCLCLPTISHTIDNHRFRLIFPLVSRISNKKTYISTMKSLVELFPEADKQCISDTARMYYPCVLGEEGFVYEGDLYRPIYNKKVPLSHPNTKRIVRVGEDVQDIVEAIYGTDRKAIPESVDYFIKNANTGLEGEWNTTLNAFVFTLALQGVDYDVVYSVVDKLAPEELDSRDEYTVDRAYNQGLEARDE